MNSKATTNHLTDRAAQRIADYASLSQSEADYISQIVADEVEATFPEMPDDAGLDGLTAYVEACQDWIAQFRSQEDES